MLCELFDKELQLKYAHNIFITQISSDFLHYQYTLPNRNQRYTNC